MEKITNFTPLNKCINADKGIYNNEKKIATSKGLINTLQCFNRPLDDIKAFISGNKSVEEILKDLPWLLYIVKQKYNDVLEKYVSYFDVNDCNYLSVAARDSLKKHIHTGDIEAFLSECSRYQLDLSNLNLDDVSLIATSFEKTLNSTKSSKIIKLIAIGASIISVMLVVKGLVDKFYNVKSTAYLYGLVFFTLINLYLRTSYTFPNITDGIEKRSAKFMGEALNRITFNDITNSEKTNLLNVNFSGSKLSKVDFDPEHILKKVDDVNIYIWLATIFSIDNKYQIKSQLLDKTQNWLGNSSLTNKDVINKIINYLLNEDCLKQARKLLLLTEHTKGRLIRDVINNIEKYLAELNIAELIYTDNRY